MLQLVNGTFCKYLISKQQATRQTKLTHKFPLGLHSRKKNGEERWHDTCTEPANMS